MPAQLRSILRVGSRQSKLALWQTNTVIGLLQAARPDLKFEIVTVTTGGDRVLDKPLYEMGGVGVFVKELEEALLLDDVDLVVHSMKDVPTGTPEGLSIVATIARADARDVLVCNAGHTFAKLPSGSRVATSSRRRAAQLHALRQDLKFVDIRGNVPTRLSKHDAGECDAIVLAAAGLLRLELSDRISEYLEPELCMPAVGQGALAIECRQSDRQVIELLESINDKHAMSLVTAERACLQRFGGGCSIPLGAHAVYDSQGQIFLQACLSDGTELLKVEARGPAEQPERLGAELAADLLAKGGAAIMDRLSAQGKPLVSPP